MKGFLSAFSKQKPNQRSRSKMEEELDLFRSGTVLTEPKESPANGKGNGYLYTGGSDHKHGESDPYVKVLNLPKDKTESTFARTKDALIERS